MTEDEPVAAGEVAVANRERDEKGKPQIEASAPVVGSVGIEVSSSMSDLMLSQARAAWTAGGGQADWGLRPDLRATSWSRSRQALVGQPKTPSAHAAEVETRERRGWDMVTAGRSAEIASACLATPWVM